MKNNKFKEFFRALFIAEMVEDGVLDYDFLKMLNTITV